MRVTPDIDAELGALLERCASHDRAALDALYRRTASPLLGCLLRILRRRALAEEALAGRVRAGVAARRPVRRASRPAVDLAGVDGALPRDRYPAARTPDERRPGRDRRDTLAAEAVDDTTTLASSSDGQVLEHCMQRLNTEQRDCIRLAFCPGARIPEIATALARPLGSVKSWIRRGLAALKECIEACAPQTQRLIDRLAAEYVLGTLRGPARRSLRALARRRRRDAPPAGTGRRATLGRPARAPGRRHPVDHAVARGVAADPATHPERRPVQPRASAARAHRGRAGPWPRA